MRLLGLSIRGLWVHPRSDHEEGWHKFMPSSSEEEIRADIERTFGLDPASKQWRIDLIERLGYMPGQWNGRQHSADQLVGILRELEDGEDPYAEERKGTIEDWVSLDSANRSTPRDERDAQLRRAVDLGKWATPPGSWRRPK